MITTILRTADKKDITAARHYAADHLHVSFLDVQPVIGVAYICQHFEQGAYSGWDGWVEMREADAR